MALALALAKRDQPSVVLERQQDFAPLGAGIQIGPNGMRVLQALGVADALQPFAGVPEAIVVHAGASGRVLTQLPLGNWIASRHGAPYWVAHRGDLHRALLDAAATDSRITVRTGFDVASIAQTDASVTATDRSVRPQPGEPWSGPTACGRRFASRCPACRRPGSPAPPRRAL